MSAAKKAPEGESRLLPPAAMTSSDAYDPSEEPMERMMSMVKEENLKSLMHGNEQADEGVLLRGWGEKDWSAADDKEAYGFQSDYRAQLEMAMHMGTETRGLTQRLGHLKMVMEHRKEEGVPASRKGAAMEDFRAWERELLHRQHMKQLSHEREVAEAQAARREEEAAAQAEEAAAEAAATAPLWSPEEIGAARAELAALLPELTEEELKEVRAKAEVFKILSQPAVLDVKPPVPPPAPPAEEEEAEEEGEGEEEVPAPAPVAEAAPAVPPGLGMDGALPGGGVPDFWGEEVGGDEDEFLEFEGGMRDIVTREVDALRMRMDSPQ